MPGIKSTTNLATDIEGLPFVSKTPTRRNMWTVNPTGDLDEDFCTGRRYAAQLVQLCRKREAPNLLHYVMQAWTESTPSLGELMMIDGFCTEIGYLVAESPRPLSAMPVGSVTEDPAFSDIWGLTGDYSRDCSVGRLFGERLAERQRQTRDFALLQHVAQELRVRHSIPGEEESVENVSVGFATALMEAAISAPGAVTAYQRRAAAVAG
jgi:hypothetical protein